MILHTDPRLSGIFGRVCQPAKLDALRPILLTGRLGVGRRHYVKAAIRHASCLGTYRPFSAPLDRIFDEECDCPSCRQVTEGAGPDIEILDGREGVAALRESVERLTSHNPSSMPANFLVLTGLHRYRAATSDVLLKVLEEPPDHLKVFGTASSGASVPGAVYSRFREITVCQPSPAQIEWMAGRYSEMRDYPRGDQAYPFRTLGTLAIAGRLDFEGHFQNLFLSADFPAVERRMREFIAEAKSDRQEALPDILEFLVDWLEWRTRTYCSEKGATNPGLLKTLQLLPSLFRRSQESLGAFLQRPDASQHVNLDNQMISLVSGLNLLRRLTTS